MEPGFGNGLLVVAYTGSQGESFQKLNADNEPLKCAESAMMKKELCATSLAVHYTITSQELSR